MNGYSSEPCKPEDLRYDETLDAVWFLDRFALPRNVIIEALCLLPTNPPKTKE